MCIEINKNELDQKLKNHKSDQNYKQKTDLIYPIQIIY